MSYWLVKTEPEEYSWERLVQEKTAAWTGVRNFEARNALKEMKKGDFVLVYHTGDEKALRGIAKVAKEAYPDPTAERGDWVAVDLAPVKELGREISLEELRNTHNLCVMPVVERPRLSVHAVTDSQWQDVLKYSKTTL